MPNPIYLDHNATNPVPTEVAEAMSGALREVYSNHSSSYSLGQTAALAIADARQSVGSACHSGDEGPSGVLGAMGLSVCRASDAVRLSTGQKTTAEDIELSAHGLIEAWTQLTTD